MVIFSSLLPEYFVASRPSVRLLAPFLDRLDPPVPLSGAICTLSLFTSVSAAPCKIHQTGECRAPDLLCQLGEDVFSWGPVVRMRVESTPEAASSFPNASVVSNHPHIRAQQTPIDHACTARARTCPGGWFPIESEKKALALNPRGVSRVDFSFLSRHTGSACPNCGAGMAETELSEAV